MKKRGCVPAAALLAILGAAGPALAGPPKLALSVRWTWEPSGGSSAFGSSYDPHSEYPVPGSYARQALSIDSLSGRGGRVGLTALWGATAGLRLTVGWSETALGGANSDFEFLYKYTAWYPPLSNPTEAAYSSRLEWPRTDGRLTRLSGALEFVLRRPLGKAVSLSLSVGPALSVFSGSAGPLAYAEVVYASHGAIFLGAYFVRLRLPARAVLGLAAGTELSVRLGERLDLLLGLDYGSGAYEARPEIASAYDYAFLAEQPPALLAKIKSRLVFGSLTVKPAPFRYGIGLRLGL